MCWWADTGVNKSEVSGPLHLTTSLLIYLTLFIRAKRTFHIYVYNLNVWLKMPCDLIRNTS